MVTRATSPLDCTCFGSRGSEVQILSPRPNFSDRIQEDSPTLRTESGAFSFRSPVRLRSVDEIPYGNWDLGDAPGRAGFDLSGCAFFLVSLRVRADWSAHSRLPLGSPVRRISSGEAPGRVESEGRVFWSEMSAMTRLPFIVHLTTPVASGYKYQLFLPRNRMGPVLPTTSGTSPWIFRTMAGLWRLFPGHAREPASATSFLSKGDKDLPTSRPCQFPPSRLSQYSFNFELIFNLPCRRQFPNQGVIQLAQCFLVLG